MEVDQALIVGSNPQTAVAIRQEGRIRFRIGRRLDRYN
jgi:hypothetical protein